MGRFREGWELTKKSWALLRSNKQLFKFVIYGALAAIAVTIVFVFPGVVLIEEEQRVIGGLLVAIGIYGATFLSIYFAVGLAASADALFHGRPSSFGDGMAVARSHTGAIAGWAALSALIGMIVSALQRSGSIGEIDHRLADRRGVVADLVHVDPGDRVRGHRAVGDAEALGVAVQGALGRPGDRRRRDRRDRLPRRGAAGDPADRRRRLPLDQRLGRGGLAGGAVLVAVGAVLLVVSMLIAQAMRSVFAVALYRFATTGEAPATFTEDELRSAVRTK